VADFDEEGIRLVLQAEGLCNWSRRAGRMSSVSGETPGRREHLFRGRRVKVRDLIDANLLKPGGVLVYDRPQVGETFKVTVTETGRLRLPDGRRMLAGRGGGYARCR